MLVAVTPQLEAALRSLEATRCSGASDLLLEEMRGSLATEYELEEGTQPVRGISPALLTTLRPHLEKVMGIAGSEAAKGGIAGLLQGSKLVYLDKLAASDEGRERGARIEQRRRHLMMQSQEAEYQRLTANIRRNRDGLNSDIQASLKFQVGIAANLVVAALSMFVIGYYVSKYLGFNDAHRLVAGMVCAVAIMVVEIIVFAIRSQRADANLRRQRSRYSSNAGHLYGPPAAAGAAAAAERRPQQSSSKEAPTTPREVEMALTGGGGEG